MTWRPDSYPLYMRAGTDALAFRLGAVPRSELSVVTPTQALGRS